jgi:NAD(P)-dependent dehydrogenase (short-subunit alcohol dehydrogenase family)
MNAPGRAAVVTGAARGIGRATAVALAKNGFRVALADIRGPEMQVTAALVREAGSEALALEGDVTSLATAQRQAAAVLAAWERVDVLVNNAGISQPKGLLEITEEEWDRTIDTHLKGAFNWCKALAPAMLAQRAGRIVTMSSVSAHTLPRADRDGSHRRHDRPRGRRRPDALDPARPARHPGGHRAGRRLPRHRHPVLHDRRGHRRRRRAVGELSARPWPALVGSGAVQYNPATSSTPPTSR